MKKKNFFLAAMAVLTMATSCSQDEQQSVNKGHAISFNAALDVTRGNDMTTKKLDDFWVNAANEKDLTDVLFRNLQFTKISKDENRWVSTPPKYWPTNKVVKFYAYAPEAAKNGFSIDRDNMGKINDFTVKEKVDDQIDLIAGSTSGNETANATSGVTNLLLHHALSKITFKVKGKPNGYSCKIERIGLGNVQNSGAYKIDKKTWEIKQTDEVVNYFHKVNTLITKASDEAKELGPDGGLKLLPQTLTPWDKKKEAIHQKLKQAFIYMYVTATDSTDNNKVIFKGFAYLPIPNIAWEANKEYIYTIDLSKGVGYGGGIKPWDPKDPDPDPDKPVPVDPGTAKPDQPVLTTKHPIIFVDVSVSEWTDKKNQQSISVSQD